MKYRIEIRELNNGDVKYIPQVDGNSNSPVLLEQKSIFGENSNHPILPGIYQPKWMNLVRSGTYIGYDKITLDNIREAHFETEEDAISFIEEHKKQYAIESAFRVKKVTYKEL